MARGSGASLGNVEEPGKCAGYYSQSDEHQSITEKMVRNWGSIAFWQQSGETLEASMEVHVSRASEKTHGAGQMRLSVHVYQCPSKDTHLLWVGAARSRGPWLVVLGEQGLRQLTEPTLLSSLQDRDHQHSHPDGPDSGHPCQGHRHRGDRPVL